MGVKVRIPLKLRSKRKFRKWIGGLVTVNSSASFMHHFHQKCLALKLNQTDLEDLLERDLDFISR